MSKEKGEYPTYQIRSCRPDTLLRMFQLMDNGQYGQTGAHVARHVTMVCGHEHGPVPTPPLPKGVNNVLGIIRRPVYAICAHAQVCTLLSV